MSWRGSDQLWVESLMRRLLDWHKNLMKLKLDSLRKTKESETKRKKNWKIWDFNFTQRTNKSDLSFKTKWNNFESKKIHIFQTWKTNLNNIVSRQQKQSIVMFLKSIFSEQEWQLLKHTTFLFRRWLERRKMLKPSSQQQENKSSSLTIRRQPCKTKLKTFLTMYLS